MSNKRLCLICCVRNISSNYKRRAGRAYLVKDVETSKHPPDSCVPIALLLLLELRQLPFQLKVATGMHQMHTNLMVTVPIVQSKTSVLPCYQVQVSDGLLCHQRAKSFLPSFPNEGSNKEVSDACNPDFLLRAYFGLRAYFRRKSCSALQSKPATHGILKRSHLSCLLVCRASLLLLLLSRVPLEVCSVHHSESCPASYHLPPDGFISCLKAFALEGSRKRGSCPSRLSDSKRQ